MNRADLRAALADANVRAFLAVIRAGEGTSDADGYRRCFGGSLFDSFADHPRRVIRAGGYTSTAAGAYQFLSRTWDGLVAQYGFQDFSPQCQDEGAVALISGRKALDDVIAGRVEAAIGRCNREWASLPGSPYGQPTRTLAQALAVYDAAGGSRTPVPLVQTDQNADDDEHRAPPGDETASPAPTPAPAPADAPQPRKEFTVPPFLLAALPALIDAIPKLAALFGKDGPNTDEPKAVAIAQTVAQIAMDATGAKNIQEAVEAIASDPAMHQSAAQAVQDNWFALTEAGGGGIDGAREYDVQIVEKIGGFWRSPSFAALALLLPLAYMIVGSVAGLWGYSAWSDDVRAAISTAVVSLIIGGAAGYYWGAATGSRKAT